MFIKIVFLKDFFIYCLLKTPAGQDSSIGRRYILQNLLVNSLFAQARAGVIIEADLIKFSKKLVKLNKEHINFIFTFIIEKRTLMLLQDGVLTTIVLAVLLPLRYSPSSSSDIYANCIKLSASTTGTLNSSAIVVPKVDQVCSRFSSF